jgi:hypothetical protein
MINKYNIKAGTTINLDFKYNGSIAFSKKSKIREGWAEAFSLYAKEGEDNLMLPDFLDTEINAFL